MTYLSHDDQAASDRIEVSPAAPIPQTAQRGSVGRAALRRLASDEKIATAVLEIIRTGGLQAVTIEGVAARAGVAKTTIYRRYRDRFELLSGALDQLTPTPDYRDRGVTAASLGAMLRDVQYGFEERIGLAAVGRILASDELSSLEWRNRLVTPRFKAIGEFFAFGVQEGVLKPEVDYGLITEMAIGGMIVRDAVAGDVPDDWPDQVVQTLWPLISRP